MLLDMLHGRLAAAIVMLLATHIALLFLLPAGGPRLGGCHCLAHGLLLP